MYRIRIPVSFKKALTISLTGLIFWSAASVALASDWVEGGSKPEEDSFFLPPESNVFEAPPTSSNSRQEVIGKDKSENPTGHSKPLEATISKKSSRFPGLDASASLIMEQAPLPIIPNNSERVDPSSYRHWLQATHPNLIGKISRDQIIEVKGKWDDSGHTLSSFGFPHKTVGDNDLGDLDLSKCMVLVINCPGNLSVDSIMAVRKFVGSGGYLLTTDWALFGVLQKAFPAYVEASGESAYLESLVVDAVIVSPDETLFKGVPRVAPWELVKKSQYVKILRPGPVRVLVRSRLLSRQDPEQFGILAFLLEFKRGKVLHLVSHFDNNSDRAFKNLLADPSPEIKISMRQALAANFIAEALEGAVIEPGH